MRVAISGSPALGQLELVELVQVVEQLAAHGARHARRVGEVEDRVAGGAELHALVLAGQEAAAPVVVEEELAAGVLLVARGHHDEGGQVVVEAAQAVAEPRADAGPARLLGAGQVERDGRRVVDLRAGHRLDEADVVGDRRRCAAGSR